MGRRLIDNNKNAKDTRNNKRSNGRRNKFIIPGIIFSLVIIIVISVVAVNMSKSEEAGVEHIHTDAQGTTHVGLNIVKSELTQSVKFYPLKINGTKMEVLAVKLADGAVKAALNICESCYSSGKGYYKQQGDLLICQNCGDNIAVNKIGTNQDGCNPVPIPTQYMTNTDDSIIVAKTFLTSKQSMFKNWGK